MFTIFGFEYKIKNLPDKSGVYIMKNINGDVIYVGKAKNLKNRVKQYFSKTKKTPKVTALVSNIYDFEYIITDSEVEALVLECNLIKEYMPKYNILLKDDKTYPFIRVGTNEPFPKVTIVRSVKKDGAKYFGPYSSATALKELVELIRDIFKIRSCNKKFPQDLKKSRPCLYYHIGKCMGVCTAEFDEKEYNKIIDEVCLFLKGKTSFITNKLTNEMKLAAQNLDFEKAAYLRDKLSSIDILSQKQKASNIFGGNVDAVALSVLNTNACVQIFFMRSGKIIGRENYFLENIDGFSKSSILYDFVKQYYSSSSFIPDELLLQFESEEQDILGDFLSKLKGRKVEVKVPKIGDNLKLINMISLNAKKELQNRELKILRDVKFKNHALVGLKKELSLNDVPRRIEAYDVSGFGGKNLVGAMVTFIDAKPYKKDYRTFKIKTVSQNDDYSSMYELLKRRLKYLTNQNQDINEKFPKKPDLIFVDGGIGQVNVAIKALLEENISIPVFGIVKDDNHNTRAIISNNGEIKIDKSSEAFMLIVNIQNEMHRRAITHYRNLSTKGMAKSELDNIKGVGPKRRATILKHFKSIKNIKKASLEEINAVEGIDKKTAQNIYDYFRRDND